MADHTTAITPSPGRAVIEPYYQDEWTTILHGDVLDLLAGMGGVA